jgi:endogenous inhibitor of DNA gyrase (YacG/DUF329 family)
MTAPAMAWRTDDPCPVCGTGLTATDDENGDEIRQDCPLCGWSASWQAALDLAAEPRPVRPATGDRP